MTKKFKSLEVTDKAKFYKKLYTHSQINIQEKLKCKKLKTKNEVILSSIVNCKSGLTSSTQTNTSSTVIDGQFTSSNINADNVNTDSTVIVSGTTTVENPLNYTINYSNLLLNNGIITLPPGNDGNTIYVISSPISGSSTISTTLPDLISGTWNYIGKNVRQINQTPSLEWTQSVGDIVKFTYINGIYYMEGTSSTNLTTPP